MKTLEKFYNSLLVKDGFSDITVENYRRVLSKALRDVDTLKPKKEQI